MSEKIKKPCHAFAARQGLLLKTCKSAV